VAELRAELTPLILSTLEWLLVAVVLALVLGFVAAMWLSRPVGELNRAAARIAQGDFVTPVRVREGFAARELLALAQTFNQMAHQMSGAYQTLEEKVSQRTQELQNANRELARSEQAQVGISGQCIPTSSGPPCPPSSVSRRSFLTRSTAP